jgi:hypothetical protein
MLVLVGLVMAMLAPMAPAQAATGLPSGVTVTFTHPDQTFGVPVWSNTQVAFGITISNTTNSKIWVCGRASAYINNTMKTYLEFSGSNSIAIPPKSSNIFYGDYTIQVSSTKKDTRGLRKEGPNGEAGGWTWGSGTC